jgi:hypothetical protein
MQSVSFMSWILNGLSCHERRLIHGNYIAWNSLSSTWKTALELLETMVNARGECSNQYITVIMQSTTKASFCYTFPDAERTSEENDPTRKLKHFQDLTP